MFGDRSKLIGCQVFFFDGLVVGVAQNNVNLLVFANLLKKTKIKIDTASSGLEMLQMVRMNHYNMIFLDHRMPGMDGIEAFHNMKKMTDGLNFNTPVVALTANAVLGARQLYIDEGFNDYISKPVDTVRLEQVLLEYLPPDLIVRGDDMTADEPANVSAEAPANSADSAEAEDPSAKFKSIPGIDYNAAVTNCGTEDTFVQALEIFYNSLDKKADEIEGFEREKDIKNYTIKVRVPPDSLARLNSRRTRNTLRLAETRTMSQRLRQRLPRFSRFTGATSSNSQKSSGQTMSLICRCLRFRLTTSTRCTR